MKRAALGIAIGLAGLIWFATELTVHAQSSLGLLASNGGSLVVPQSAGAGEKSGYAVLLPLLMLAILAACAGTLYPEGLWSNAIRLVNVVFAALLAVNFWEPLARFAEEQEPTFTFFWDFLCLWGLFCIFLIVFRLLTDFISRVKLRFRKIVDQIGGAFFGLWVGYVMVCFTMFTFHTAPLAERFMGGGFQPGESNFFFLAPDLQWAGFVQKMSLGPFCRTLADDELGRYGAAEKESEKYLAVFDRQGDFVPKYAARRRWLEQYVEQHGTPRVMESDVIPR
ncbi:MAG TPA: CvpA family protein [Thermoguttaceae bacterium]|nr:CvpA family protein [Thermoguttaceae bacterium]HPP52303.1 CvpA family protein [Thermoguttaceae bacterium]